MSSALAARLNRIEARYPPMIPESDRMIVEVSYEGDNLEDCHLVTIGKPHPHPSAIVKYWVPKDC
jgi:hypothetical protein